MRKFGKILIWILGGFLCSLVLSVVYYTIFALLFTSDVEKALVDENRLYEQYIPEVEERAALLSEELDYLNARDGLIYKTIFNSEVPAMNEIMDNGLMPEDTKGRVDVVERAATQSVRAVEEAARIDDFWREVFDSLASSTFRMPPMNPPVKELDYKNIGASVGEKLNPFYKMTVYHEGLDISAPNGTSVYAPAAGKVTKIQNTNGGKGNLVEITHSGGYVTRYAHLSEINVKKGNSVKAGARIGKVGDSGRSFTNHLHYEVFKDGEPIDPCNTFFGVVTPEDYLKILVNSASSGQSLD